ncbi:calcium-binding and coiled-coil domain-containing protein 2 isoform X2 [Podarcis raffonei]|uniref:calcium-binding and coiled-coil domain-containing protein 2 isoform X2 n=1 Tax=Podarcis raffonei TaxID=65483 RepID=UPI002329907C|nr:calcium-binding and coiled-coil domain-containing protein 2 isoform X2 [Podarcis raffonei]
MYHSVLRSYWPPRRKERCPAGPRWLTGDGASPSPAIGSRTLALAPLCVRVGQLRRVAGPPLAGRKTLPFSSPLLPGAFHRARQRKETREESRMEAALCNNSEEPPTSAVLLDCRAFNQVIFTDIDKYYVPGADITCHYNISRHITPRRKDWVGIFRVGWKTAREYFTFVWAPLPRNPDSSDDELQEVLFKAYYLPKDDEYYQFCYVDQDGLVRGASVPFQFRAETEDDMLVVTTQGEVEEIEQQNTTLLQENQTLKENLKSLRNQNEDLQEKLKAAEEKAKELEDKVHLLQTGTMELQRAQDLQALQMASAQTELAAVTENSIKLQKEKEDLQRNLDTLRSSKENLEVEVNILKQKFAALETQNSSTDEELFQTKEENKKVLAEKEQLEKKLRNTLNCVDQLQQNLEKKLEEEVLSHQTLQKEMNEMEKENKRLRRENEELMVHLPEILDHPPGVLTQSPENSVLVYGNPYTVNPAIPETELVSVRKCPMCDEVFPNDIGEQQYSDHVRSHLLECPYCDESFDNSNKQVYDDHVYCHGLD